MKHTTVPVRKDVKREATWDTEQVFATREAWEREIDAVNAGLSSVERYRDRLGTAPSILLEWLNLMFRLRNQAERVYLYASMFSNVDMADPEATAMRDRAVAVMTRVISEVAFTRPEILTIGLERLREWTTAEPRLAVYAHLFDELERLRSHIRSPEVEELLGQVQGPFISATQIHGMLADADLQFAQATSSSGERIDVAQGTIAALLSDNDREVRRTAWQSYADAHLAHKHSMAACLSTGVKQDVFEARARGYSSSLEAALGPNHIPTTVFHNLIETFRSSLPIWHRYWRLRRRALGMDTLHVYDARAPLTTAMPTVPIEQATAWICEGMAPLGTEYVETMRKGLTEERWVDLYPNQGKRMGAYSHGIPGTHPFILMSYTGDIFSMSTLAHELGHSMHSWLTWREQPLVYSDYSLFVAEVASNFNQAMVRAYLLDQSSDRAFQFAVIEEGMANFHRYLFIMPTLARFELEIHERVERGDALSADTLIGLMSDLFAEAYGPDVTIDIPRVGITWAQFSTHLYSNFYVYQYATGISAANALAAGIREGNAGAVDNYLAFLRAGASLYPLDALRLAGIDMASPEPVERAFGVLSGLVDRLEALVD